MKKLALGAAAEDAGAVSDHPTATEEKDYGETF